MFKKNSYEETLRKFNKKIQHQFLKSEKSLFVWDLSKVSWINWVFFSTLETIQVRFSAKSSEKVFVWKQIRKNLRKKDFVMFFLPIVFARFICFQIKSHESSEVNFKPLNLIFPFMFSSPTDDATKPFHSLHTDSYRKLNLTDNSSWKRNLSTKASFKREIFRPPHTLTYTTSAF